MDKQKIGDFIKQKRKEKGLTQKELADKLYITDRAISKWERGICCPDISILKDLCKILDININELLSGNDIKEISNEESENILVETVKAYTDIEKKKTRKLLIFTICLLTFYVFLIYAMYLTYNQMNQKNGINFEIIQTKHIANKLFKALENYDYDEIRRIETRYTDAKYSDVLKYDDETKCMEYLKEADNYVWGIACRLKDFQKNGIKIKSHKFYHQHYASLGSYWVVYKLIVSYNDIESEMYVDLATHNGVIDRLSGTGLYSIERTGPEMIRQEYPNIADKVGWLFDFYQVNYDPEYNYMSTIDR